MALDLKALEHAPKWVWVAGIGGALVLAYWYNHQQSSTAAPAPAATPPTDTLPPDTTQGTSGLCPAFTFPVCPTGQHAIIEQDQNGCPIAVCSGDNQPPPPDNKPVCHSTLHGGTYIVGRTGPLTTLRQIFNHVGQDVNCAVQWNPTAINRGLDIPLWPGFVVYY